MKTQTGTVYLRRSITITDQETRRFVAREGLDDRLSRTLCCRMRCYIEVDAATSITPKYKETKQDAKRRGGRHEEVYGVDSAKMIVQKRLPSLRRRLSITHHVFVDCGFRHGVSEQPKFGLNPRRASRP